MGKILREIRYPDRTPEWYEYRKTCLGASSVAVVLGLNEYVTASELLWKKCGFINEKNNNNKFTHFGIVTEDIIAREYWQYYDPMDPDALYENAQHGKIVRKCRKLNGFTWDSDYPWLKCSLDRVMAKGSFNLLTGEEVEPRSPLEIKTINSFVFKKYQEQPPASYVVQVQSQMIASGTHYGEIGGLVDRDFHVFPYERREELSEAIIEASKTFMGLVAEGQELKEEYDKAMFDGNHSLADDIMHRMDEITPGQVEGQEGIYKQFLDKRFQENDRAMPQIIGDKKHYTLVKEIKYLDEIAKHLKDKVEFRKNELKRFIGINEHLKFEDNDIRVSYKNNAKGNKYFRIHADEEFNFRDDAISVCKELEEAV